MSCARSSRLATPEPPGCLNQPTPTGTESLHTQLFGLIAMGISRFAVSGTQKEAGEMLDTEGHTFVSVWERHGGITPQLRVLMPICEFVGMCECRADGSSLVFFLPILTLNPCSLLPLPASPMHVLPLRFVPLAVRSSWTFDSSSVCCRGLIQPILGTNWRKQRTSEKRSAELGLRPAAH